MAIDEYWIDSLDTDTKVSDTHNLFYHLDKCTTGKEEDMVLDFWSNLPIRDELGALSTGVKGYTSVNSSTSVAACFSAAASGGTF